MPVRLPRVLFLDARRVRQHERAQVARARRAEDAAAKALADQPRQVAAVIEMRVREDDGVDRAGRDRERGPVAQPQLLEALEQAAVDENAMVAEIEQMLRAGDGAGGAEKRQRGRHRRALYSEGSTRWLPSIS